MAHYVKPNGDTVQLGKLSKPATVNDAPVRPLTLQERHDMAALEAAEHYAELQAAYRASREAGRVAVMAAARSGAAL